MSLAFDLAKAIYQANNKSETQIFENCSTAVQAYCVKQAWAAMRFLRQRGAILPEEASDIAVRLYTEDSHAGTGTP
jgi:hypothetical protein